MKRILAAAVLALASTPVSALPKAAPGADALCSGYAETHEGVWTNAGGVDVLRFRFAMNPDGSGCYAWLNAVEAWGIDGAGSRLDAEGYRADGDRRIAGRPEQGRGIELNLATGEALYATERGITGGRVLSGR